MKWARAHWLVGTATLLLFPLAGVYMRYIALVPQLADAPRLMYRSRFLFLLLIALANLALAHRQPVKVIERLASFIILIAPAPMVIAFMVDPGRGVRSSVWTVTTMRGLFGAAVLLAIAYRPSSQVPLRKD